MEDSTRPLDNLLGHFARALPVANEEWIIDYKKRRKEALAQARNVERKMQIGDESVAMKLPERHRYLLVTGFCLKHNLLAEIRFRCLVTNNL